MEKSKKIYIVINFTGLEKQMFIIADLKNKENLKAIYTAYDGVRVPLASD